MKQLPEALHFVGVGGIGMSALAQMAADLGFRTSGSDRSANAPENRRIIGSLERRGVKIYPQDGSRMKETILPGALVYSTAIEETNPDFAAARGIPRVHRSEAMKLLVEKSGSKIAAVTGSCGKTSVTAWLAEALDRLGADPSMVSGGLANRFATDSYAGNYHHGRGELCVLEADESDKSLLHYTAEHTLVLNIGTDHYDKTELARVFREFLTTTRSTAVLSDDVYRAVGPECVRHLRTMLFSTDPAAPDSIDGIPVLKADHYEASHEGVFATVGGIRMSLPAPGLHNAANAAAVCAALRLLGYSAEDGARAAEAFSGVWRRFECAGTTASGVRVFDDYAHNVEKICSCIASTREITRGRSLFVFQPHGYGPFGFMRGELCGALEKALGKEDVFAFLPVYYAGGTSSFTPKAEDVAAEYAKILPGRILYFADRAAAEEWMGKNLSAGDTAAVMGARDNSLSDWARFLVKHGAA